MIFSLRGFKSQTPQGDGNESYFMNNKKFVEKVSNHKPRKGTET